MKLTILCRIILSFVFLISFISVYPQKVQKGISTSHYYNGYWSQWKETDYDWVSIGVKYAHIRLSGDFDGYCLYYKDSHPSEFFFRFSISDYIQPTKKEIKQHYKTHTKWIYSGTVEYYVCDVYPTFEDCIKELKRPLMKSDMNTSDYQSRLSVIKANQIRKTGHFSPIGYKKVTKNAEIRIMPYKKVPECYNFIFDNVGYAVDLGVFSTRISSGR